MRNFKIKWSTEQYVPRGGSFQIVINEENKTFDIHSITGSRASFNTVLQAVEKIVLFELEMPELFLYQRKNPYKIQTQKNMSTTKHTLIVLESKKVFQRQTVYVPKIFAQLTASCYDGTGFGWDDRNFCSFLPDLFLFINQFRKNTEEYHEVFHIYETEIFYDIPPGFTQNSFSDTENLSEEKLIIE